MLQAPTYIVLDLPPAIAAGIHAIRERYDRNLARLPAEITVAGSSGVGGLSPAQELKHVFGLVESVGGRILPFTTAFVGISRFPGTSVYWLGVRDRLPFDALQAGFVEAGLQFESTPFTYTPHCTLSASASFGRDEESRLLSEAFPAQEFILTRLSLYQKSEEGAHLLHTFSFNES